MSFTQEQRFDHERELRKHDPNPRDLTVSQRFALAKLIGTCEGVAASGALSVNGEARLRSDIAEALAAFGMPSKSERADA